jgi:hypothetical protein
MLFLMLVSDPDPPTSASWVAEITVMYHRVWLLCDSVSLTFAQVGLDLQSSYLHTPSSSLCNFCWETSAILSFITLYATYIVIFPFDYHKIFSTFWSSLSMMWLGIFYLCIHVSVHFSVGDQGSRSRSWHEHGYVMGLLADRHGPSQGESRFSKTALQEKQDTLTWSG